MNRLFLALVVFCSMAVAQTTPKPTEQLNEIAREIICPCKNCGKQAIDQCKHTCSHGIELLGELKAMVAAGESREDILQTMVRVHGEGILAAPSQNSWQGKMAPITPYLLMLLGIVPLVYITRSRHRATKARGPKQVRDTAHDDDRLDEALKKFDY